jgi:hypothetical protein
MALLIQGGAAFTTTISAATIDNVMGSSYEEKH